MFAIGRRKLLLGATALALVGGCNNAGGAAISADDVVLGAENAPVTLIEYASTTCPHCAAFHAEVWDELKANYIDTGRVRFVFREFPTPPPAVAVAGFQLARCGGAAPEQYFVRISELFRQQQAMFASGSMEGIRRRLIEIGAAAGLSEEQVNECITDSSAGDRVNRIIEGARQYNITGTPTLILNNRKLEPTPATYEDLARAIEAELAG